MTLTEVARDEVVTAAPETPVRETIELMADHDVGSVVITDEDDEAPVGIVTDRMIALGLREADAIDDVAVTDVMTTDLVTVDETGTHFEALETMREAAIRRVPVVDEQGRLTGIVTLDDLLVVAGAEMTRAADVIGHQASPL